MPLGIESVDERADAIVFCCRKLLMMSNSLAALRAAKILCFSSIQ